jgi:hypothetical protein
MKRWKLIKILADNIYHDPYAGSPNWKLDWFPQIIKENYSKIRPVLLYCARDSFVHRMQARIVFQDIILRIQKE